MFSLAKLKFSVSHTTRKPREGEVNGVDYHFVSKDTFQQMIADNMFLEHAEVHGNFYGTSHASIEQDLQDGFDVILDIDVQGAAILRKNAQVDAAFVFIAPPSLVELERRLRGRGTETEEKVQIRLINARIELEASNEYEYLIVNNDVKEATNILQAIVLAERSKSHRLPTGDPIEKVL
jgi:guanylate kinase